MDSGYSSDGSTIEPGVKFFFIQGLPPNSWLEDGIQDTCARA